MNIKLKTLTLHCNKSTEIINFNERLSYFHGRIGSGKSTILRLINYCFGEEFEKPPALQSEGISVQLECLIGEHETLLERNLSKNNEVRITWRKDQEIESLLIKTTRQNTPIFSDNIYSYSDLLFYLMGSTPIKFKRSRRKKDSPLITMTFRNLMWYCYLEQDEIDSSFYSLDQVFKREHSQNVMRFVFGDHSEKINEIEVTLAELREKRLTNNNTVERLEQFLGQYGYESTKKIEDEISNIEKILAKLKEDRKNLRKKIFPENHVIEEIREGLRNQEIQISKKTNQINDLESRISSNKSLKFDYINSKFKINKSSLALTVLAKSRFEICPQCGNKIEGKTNEDVCPLCKNSYKIFDEKEYIKNIESIRVELDDKIDELDEMINRHTKILQISKNEISSMNRKRKSLEKELAIQMENYDSIYLSKVLQIEKEISMYEEKINNYKEIKKLPISINNINKETDEILIKENKYNKLYEEEREKLTHVDEYINELESIFLSTLIKAGFPGIYPNDEIEISRKTWMPTIHSNELGTVTWTFYGVGSGGKKTLFNACYAIAVHIIAEKHGLKLPNILMIDTPMKNIPEDTNKDIFISFYTHLYELLQDELSETQIIIVDKEFFPPPDNIQYDFLHRYMTSNDENNPGLISYWREE
ncbi:MAG: AAA family ATPase [Candidatus Odinarchaeia archaeon]